MTRETQDITRGGETRDVCKTTETRGLVEQHMSLNSESIKIIDLESDKSETNDLGSESHELGEHGDDQRACLSSKKSDSIVPQQQRRHSREQTTRRRSSSAGGGAISFKSVKYKKCGNSDNKTRGGDAPSETLFDLEDDAFKTDYSLSKVIAVFCVLLKLFPCVI